MSEWAVDAFYEISSESEILAKAKDSIRFDRRAFPVVIAITSIGWFAYATKVDRPAESNQVSKRYVHLINYSSSVMHRD